MWVQSRGWCGMDRQRRAQRVGKRPSRKVRRAGGDADAECAVAPPRECTGCRAVIRRVTRPRSQRAAGVSAHGLLAPHFEYGAA